MNDGIPIRCTCFGRPMLAVCGRDDRTGEPWIHVKAYRGKRIYTEVVITSGVVQIRCRDCNRWYRVKIVRGAPRLVDEESPAQTKIS